MARAIFTAFGRLGLVGVLLVALASMALPAVAQACAPEPAAVSVDQPADPCEQDGCIDCGPACGHGCCHAAHVGLVAVAAMPGEPLAIRRAATAPREIGAPMDGSSILDRPPRA
ncbi:hypothetical protein GVN21_07475 [Caulobacter sp. SLTY]|uniref:hypothetical protein n=1 Tax=Caulobacter sp. SLTY TaxID=2683262 RepID=UPI001411F754|nr:hypothetical protein [Caulobacter sp. SLTY]NBB15194.1 hypothetical protein [Caulobacter sp. SLTY]